MEESTILLVEDNPDDAALTVRALEKQHVGNTVVVVRDGAEALDWLFAKGIFAGRDPATLPQLVLLDLRLPKLSGHDVLRAIRANDSTKRLPVVVLTSSSADNDVVESYDRGANGFARKPVEFAAFTEAVKHLGLFWLVVNRRP